MWDGGRGCWVESREESSRAIIKINSEGGRGGIWIIIKIGSNYYKLRSRAFTTWHNVILEMFVNKHSLASVSQYLLVIYERLWLILLLVIAGVTRRVLFSEELNLSRHLNPTRAWMRYSHEMWGAWCNKKTRSSADCNSSLQVGGGQHWPAPLPSSLPRLGEQWVAKLCRWCWVLSSSQVKIKLGLVKRGCSNPILSVLESGQLYNTSSVTRPPEREMSRLLWRRVWRSIIQTLTIRVCCVANILSRLL